MSIAGILSSSLFGSSTPSTSSVQSNLQKLKAEFLQLGQDLQSGNLSSAKSDFASLLKDRTQSNSSTSGQSSSPIAQEFKQLSQDLQSGNLSAAQQDYKSIQQNFQGQAAQGLLHHHHRGSSGQSEISQLIAQLGQSLQSGNLSAAQTAYTTLQNDFTQFAQTNGLQAPTPTTAAPSSSGSVSVNA